ncbi:Dammarenediol II synthase [Vitis vinifera]|uniref:Dammarenediol II synthase n=1 Tax=Vitis vinifera TaxID=29760 RepID=A0A438HZN1_VITVI|nr:Dammarenediol II synthase [Vitis vinifera]
MVHGCTASTTLLAGRSGSFDPEDGTPEEREEVRKVQENFTKNRFRYKPNGDLLMRMQLIKENQIDLSIPPVRLGENEEVTCEVVTTAVRKSVRLNRAIQARMVTGLLRTLVLCFSHPFDHGAILYWNPKFALTPEHIVLELLRYITNHQMIRMKMVGGIPYRRVQHNAWNNRQLHLHAYTRSRTDDKALAAGRKWILDRGGATYSPSWGKCYISVFGLYEWSGCNPLPPEFWLFPSFFPMHLIKFGATVEQFTCLCRIYTAQDFNHPLLTWFYN